MTDRTVFLFPGLGAYSPGILEPFARSYPQVEQVLREIDDAAAEVGAPPVTQVLLGTEEITLDEMVKRSAELLQMAIFATSLAAHRVLLAQGMQPHLLVGHSFGEISALVAAEAFTLVDGVRLVSARAAALKPWEGRGIMAAIGADVNVAEHLIGLLGEPDVVVACINSPRQTVISGPIQPIQRVVAGAQKLGLLATELHLPYASHHPSLTRAIDSFISLTRGVEQHPLEYPVQSAIHGRRYTDADDLCVYLAQGLVTRVDFTDTIRRLHAAGLTSLVEVGALRALTQSAELTVPGLTTHAPLADPARRAARPEVAAASTRGTVRQDSSPPTTPQEFTQTTMTATTPAAEVAKPQTGLSEAATTAGTSRDRVIAKIQQLYADVLEYPPALLTEEALLEAELGVDSLKQTALLSQVNEFFELPRPKAGLRALDFPSLRHVADYVVAASSQHNGSEGSVQSESTSRSSVDAL